MRSEESRRAPLGWVLALYPGLWIAGYFLSNVYWFLPTGVRLAGLLVVAPRHWPWLGLVEISAVGALALFQPHGYQTWSGAVLGIVMPWVSYALVMLLWRQHHRELLPQSPQQVLVLLGLGLLCSALVAAQLVGMRVVEGSLDAEALLGEAYSYMVGDFIGILCVAPLLLQIGSARAAWWLPSVWRDLAVTVLPLGALLLVVSHWLPGLTAQAALLVMVPPLWLAHRSGWRGASLALAGSSAVLYVSTAGVVSPEFAPMLQMMLAIVGSTSIVLGAWSGLEQRLRERLEVGNAELADANRVLNQQSEELRSLGARLVRAQEEERARIRADLRGELSQQLSAMSGQLAMLVRQVERPELLALVDTLRTHVQAIRDAADECIERLQPHGLTRMTLTESLNSGSLRTHLDAAGIHYTVRVGGDESRLQTPDRVTLYRVVQHVVAAVQRCADALSLDVAVSLPTGGEEAWAEVACSIACRAPQLEGALAGEADMRALRDRMLACGGRVDVTPVGRDGLSCVALFPLQQAELRN